MTLNAINSTLVYGMVYHSLEIVACQHYSYDVFANVMDISLHSGQNNHSRVSRFLFKRYM